MNKRFIFLYFLLFTIIFQIMDHQSVTAEDRYATLECSSEVNLCWDNKYTSRGYSVVPYCDYNCVDYKQLKRIINNNKQIFNIKVETLGFKTKEINSFKCYYKKGDLLSKIPVSLFLKSPKEIPCRWEPVKASENKFFGYKLVCGGGAKLSEYSSINDIKFTVPVTEEILQELINNQDELFYVDKEGKERKLKLSFNKQQSTVTIGGNLKSNIEIYYYKQSTLYKKYPNLFKKIDDEYINNLSKAKEYDINAILKSNRISEDFVKSFNESKEHIDSQINEAIEAYLKKTREDKVKFEQKVLVLNIQEIKVECEQIPELIVKGTYGKSFKLKPVSNDSNHSFFLATNAIQNVYGKNIKLRIQAKCFKEKELNLEEYNSPITLTPKPVNVQLKPKIVTLGGEISESNKNYLKSLNNLIKLTKDKVGSSSVGSNSLNLNVPVGTQLTEVSEYILNNKAPILLAENCSGENIRNVKIYPKESILFVLTSSGSVAKKEAQQYESYFKDFKWEKIVNQIDEVISKGFKDRKIGEHKEITICYVEKASNDNLEIIFVETYLSPDSKKIWNQVGSEKIQYQEALVPLNNFLTNLQMKLSDKLEEQNIKVGIIGMPGFFSTNDLKELELKLDKVVIGEIISTIVTKPKLNNVEIINIDKLSSLDPFIRSVLYE
jgi:hypothetical protein